MIRGAAKGAALTAFLICGSLAFTGSAFAVAPQSGNGPAVKQLETTPAPPTDKSTWVARIVQSTVARSKPDGGSAVGKVNDLAPWNKGPMQLMVVDAATTGAGALWVKVLLARKPNDSFGWIPASNTVLGITHWRIEIDISARRLEIYKSGRKVKSTRVVVGAHKTPTPVGHFAIREVVRQMNPAGFSGPYIFHLNANSEKLKSFDGGDGIIGIHGRGGASLSDPLGSARSHGCVRIPNRIVKFMSRHVVAGTPVNVQR
jgi:lipoprotein-anchoring transpeptidase ErfK/SrfK